MNAEIQTNGNLKITADAEDRAGLLENYAEGGRGFPGADADIMGVLLDLGYERVEPEWIGALTSAPILSDGVDFPDEGDPVLLEGARVWWYPSYAVIDPWEELAREREVVFQLAKEEQS